MSEEPREEPSEEEYRKALEEELRKARVEDILVQSTVTIINLASRRIAVDEERDLDQARLGIDAVAALVDYLPDEVSSQVNEALTQLRLQYTKFAGQGTSGDSDAGERPESAGASDGDSGSESGAKRPGGDTPAGQRPDSGSRLWTPPGSA